MQKDCSAPRPTRPWAQVREGLAFLVRHRVLRPLVITGSVLNLAASGYFAVFVRWVVGPESAAGHTETQYPLVMLGLAVGAVAGSLVTGSIVLFSLGRARPKSSNLTPDGVSIRLPGFRSR